MEVNGNNKNEEMIDADPIVHWERLQDSGRKRMKLMEDEKQKLQKEIDTMNSVIGIGKKSATKTSNDDDDIIIEINVGGTIICALRSTLCLVARDTMFSYMFSGRWEKSLTRDSNGRIYLEHDPELIELIVNFLRTKKIEDPSSSFDETIVCPEIPKGKEQAFRVLLNYFGLTDFFYPPVVFLPSDKNIKCPLFCLALLAMEDPVRSTICRHTFSRQAIVNHLGSSKRCPVPGCSNDRTMTTAELENDPDTATLLRRHKKENSSRNVPKLAKMKKNVHVSFKI